MKTSFKQILFILIFFAVKSVFTAEESDEAGSTLLHHATLNNKTDEVHSLIQFKANVNRKNKAGNTPLMVAASKGHDEIVKRLLDANADPLLGNNTNEVALFFAVMNKHESTALLISKEISKKRKT